MPTRFRIVQRSIVQCSISHDQYHRCKFDRLDPSYKLTHPWTNDTPERSSMRDASGEHRPTRSGTFTAECAILAKMFKRKSLLLLTFDEKFHVVKANKILWHTF